MEGTSCPLRPLEDYIRYSNMYYAAKFMEDSYSVLQQHSVKTFGKEPNQNLCRDLTQFSDPWPKTTILNQMQSNNA